MKHPTEENLIRYASDGLQAEAAREIERHVDECADCQAKLARIRAWIASTEDSTSAGLPQRARNQIDAISGRTTSVQVIDLRPMIIESPQQTVHLAADGAEPPEPTEGLRHRATLYSEDPEMVLRVMQDPDTRQDSLHLIAADSAHTRNVMIHVVDPPMDFVTDDRGVAFIGEVPLPALDSLQWQIRLPHAVFTLSPLEHEPDAAGKEELELGPDPDNRIGVTLENQPGGLSMRLRILRVDGREDLEHVRLVISQGALQHQVIETSGHEPCIVTGLSAKSPIDIRVFAN